MNTVGLQDDVPLVGEQLAAGSHTRRRTRSVKSDAFNRITRGLEVAADLVTVAAAVLLSYAAYIGLNLGNHAVYPGWKPAAAALGCAVLFIILLDREGAYTGGTSLLRIRETERALRASTLTFVLVLLVTFLAGAKPPRWAFALAFLTVPLAVITQKQIFAVVIRRLHQLGHGTANVLIVGAGFTGRRIFSVLARSPKLGLKPVAILDDQCAGEEVFPDGYTHDLSLTVLRGSLNRDLLRSLDIDTVILAGETLDRDDLAGSRKICAAVGARLLLVNGISALQPGVDCMDLDGLLVTALRPPAPPFGYKASKRVFDFLAALLGGVLLSPLLLILAALVKRSSPGPVLFVQKRVGLRGRQFDCYKFRTMYQHSCGSDYSPKSDEDPRITPIGRWLRRTSLDELPQLLNVLKGDMSLVGPRPEMPFIVARYTARQRRRLDVMPGITGLWQLSADRSFLIHENIQYDLYYIRNRNFFMDVAVLFHTAVFAMRGV